LLDPSSKTLVAAATRDGGAGIPEKSNWATGFVLAWIRFFRPCVLGFVALAIAVALWGYGYKLSLYRQQDHVTQIPVAKLWIEHRGAATEAAVSRLRAQVNVFPVCLLLPIPAVQMPGKQNEPGGFQSTETSGIAIPEYLLPFRSPPAISLLLI
jgi:hypothetical protein